MPSGLVTAWHYFYIFLNFKKFYCFYSKQNVICGMIVKVNKNERSECMIQVWIGDASSLVYPERYREYYAKLPKWRQEKVDRLAFQEDKIRSAGAWSIRELMREHYGLSDDVIYNLSHSGRYVMCAMNDEEGSKDKVGCDIEWIRNLDVGCIRRFCGDEEYARVSELKGAEQMAAAIRLWVLKESFAKAVREGLRLQFAGINFEESKDGKMNLTACPEAFAGDYYIEEYTVEDRTAAMKYRLAVCSTSPKIVTEAHMIQL